MAIPRPTLIQLHPAQPARYHQAVRDAYDDGVMLGFFYGLLAGAIAWLILSGNLVRLCVVLVRSTLALGSGL